MDTPANGAEAVKPRISAIEADRMEAIARQQGAQEAIAQGGDPAAVTGLMTMRDGHPTVCGYRLLGIIGNSYTAAALVAMQLAGRKFKTDSSLENAIADLVVLTDPAEAYKLLTADDSAAAFTAAVHQILFGQKITVAEINAINARVRELTRDASASTAAAEEEQESFMKPAEPATTSPT